MRVLHSRAAQPRGAYAGNTPSPGALRESRVVRRTGAPQSYARLAGCTG